LIAGSPSTTSRSKTFLAAADRLLRERGYHTTWVDLATLPAEALLGRTRAPEVDAALTAVATAQLVVVGTPVYRATYSGLLKVFFDLLPMDGLSQAMALPLATGASPLHALALTDGLIPLLASVGARDAGAGIYATDDQFHAGQLTPALHQRVIQAVDRVCALLGPASAEPVGRP
jgi:FMN reductase